MYLYKAMEALIASKKVNPLHEGANASASVTTATDVPTTVNVTSSNSDNNGSGTSEVPNGEADGGVIERRHSASASSNVTTDLPNGTPGVNGGGGGGGGSGSRRHSLPSTNGTLDSHEQCPFTSLPVTIKDVEEAAKANSTSNGNGCALAIDMNGDTQDEEDYEDEDDISETAALTQKTRKIKEIL